MFNKEKIDLIIKNNWNLKTAEIAELLNQANLKTEHNRDWTQPHVSKYANKVLSLRKKAEHTRDHSKEENISEVVVGEIVVEEKEEKKEITIEQGLSLIEKSIVQKDNKFFTDSLSIAKIFEKEHRHVLDAIKNCECSDKFRSAEFSADVYLDTYNRQMPKFNLTKKGMAKIVLGFTGKKAAVFQEAYIEKFEELENKVSSNVPSSPLELILSIAQQLVSNEQKTKQLENNINSINSKVISFEQKQKEAELSLQQLPPASTLPLQANDRINVVDRVRLYSKKSFVPISTCWDSLYYKFGRIKGMNIEARAKAKKVEKLDYIESIGAMKEFYDFSCSMFPIEGFNHG